MRLGALAAQDLEQARLVGAGLHQCAGGLAAGWTAIEHGCLLQGKAQSGVLEDGFPNRSEGNRACAGTRHVRPRLDRSGTDKVPPMPDRAAIVTGASRGIGFALA